MHKAWLILPSLLAVVAIAVFAALMTSGTPTALADEDLHTAGSWGATPADCVICHRAHRGQVSELLVTDQVSMCYSCHGNDASGSELNVKSGTQEDVDEGALRGGGFTLARIDTDDPDGDVLALLAEDAEDTMSAHSIDASAQVLWGYGAIADDPADPGLGGYPLTCGKCHDPHGNGNYRILREVPSGLEGSHYGDELPGFTPDLDGLLVDDDPHVYSTADYWDVSYTDQWVDSSVVGDEDDLAETETTGRQVGLWCTTCHNRYGAYTGAAGEDSGDAIFAYRHTSLPEGRGTHGREDRPVRLSGSCLVCHVSHGSNAVVSGEAADVEMPDEVSPGPGATSDSRLLRVNNRGVCQQCHHK